MSMIISPNLKMVSSEFSIRIFRIPLGPPCTAFLTSPRCPSAHLPHPRTAYIKHYTGAEKSNKLASFRGLNMHDMEFRSVNGTHPDTTKTLISYELSYDEMVHQVLLHDPTSESVIETCKEGDKRNRKS